MARLRVDYVLGVTEYPMNSSSDVLLISNSLGRLPGLAAGADDFYAVTLTDAASGEYEIVHVIEHNAQSTLTTVVRAQEGSTARAWPVGSTWVHGPTADDFAPASPSLLSAHYKGAWTDGDPYVLADTVTHSSKLWEALSDAPSGEPGAAGGGGGEVAYAGGPDAPSINVGAFHRQSWTFTEDKTFQQVRISGLNSNLDYKVGFAVSSAGTPDAAETAGYVASALCAGSGTSDPYGAAVNLSAPLTVTAGQTLWMFTRCNPSADVYYADEGDQTITGSVTMGALERASGNDPTATFATFYGATYHLGVQLIASPVSGGEPAWGLALDFS